MANEKFVPRYYGGISGLLGGAGGLLGRRVMRNDMPGNWRNLLQNVIGTYAGPENANALMERINQAQGYLNEGNRFNTALGEITNAVTGAVRGEEGQEGPMANARNYFADKINSIGNYFQLPEDKNAPRPEEAPTPSANQPPVAPPPPPAPPTPEQVEAANYANMTWQQRHEAYEKSLQGRYTKATQGMETPLNVQGQQVQIDPKTGRPAQVARMTQQHDWRGRPLYKTDENGNQVPVMKPMLYNQTQAVQIAGQNPGIPLDKLHEVNGQRLPLSRRQKDELYDPTPQGRLNPTGEIGQALSAYNFTPTPANNYQEQIQAATQQTIPTVPRTRRQEDYLAANPNALIPNTTANPDATMTFNSTGTAVGSNPMRQNLAASGPTVVTPLPVNPGDPPRGDATSQVNYYGTAPKTSATYYNGNQQVTTNIGARQNYASNPGVTGYTSAGYMGSFPQNFTINQRPYGPANNPNRQQQATMDSNQTPLPPPGATRINSSNTAAASGNNNAPGVSTASYDAPMSPPPAQQQGGGNQGGFQFSNFAHPLARGGKVPRYGFGGYIGGGIGLGGAPILAGLSYDQYRRGNKKTALGLGIGAGASGLIGAGLTAGQFLKNRYDQEIEAAMDPEAYNNMAEALAYKESLAKAKKEKGSDLTEEELNLIREGSKIERVPNAPYNPKNMYRLAVKPYVKDMTRLQKSSPGIAELWPKPEDAWNHEYEWYTLPQLEALRERLNVDNLRGGQIINHPRYATPDLYALRNKQYQNIMNYTPEDFAKNKYDQDPSHYIDKTVIPQLGPSPANESNPPASSNAAAYGASIPRYANGWGGYALGTGLGLLGSGLGFGAMDQYTKRRMKTAAGLGAGSVASYLGAGGSALWQYLRNKAAETLPEAQQNAMFGFGSTPSGSAEVPQAAPPEKKYMFTPKEGGHPLWMTADQIKKLGSTYKGKPYEHFRQQMYDRPMYEALTSEGFDPTTLPELFHEADEATYYNSFDPQSTSTTNAYGGPVPRYSFGGYAPSYAMGGFSQAIAQQMAMNEAQRMQATNEQGGDQSYYDRAMMESTMSGQAQEGQQAQAQAQAQGAGTYLPSGVYDPTGQLAQYGGMQPAAQDATAVQSQIAPQIKSRIPYYAQMYSKLAQKATAPKGATKRIMGAKRKRV